MIQFVQGIGDDKRYIDANRRHWHRSNFRATVSALDVQYSTQRDTKSSHKFTYTNSNVKQTSRRFELSFFPYPFIYTDYND